MSTSAAVLPTPDATVVSDDPHADLWTSDSERGLTAPDTLIREVEIDDEPAPAPLAATEAPADPAEPETVSGDRDPNGQFRKGRGKPKHDPVARMQAATAKEAAAKEEARLAREETQRVKAELDALRSQGTRPPAPQTTAQPSNGTTFTFPKRDAWMAEHPAAEWDDYDDAKLDARDAWRQGQQTQHARLSRYQERAAEVAAVDPGFEPAMRAGLPVLRSRLEQVGLSDLPDVLSAAILDSPRAVDIFRHFVSHPEVAVQWAVDAAKLPESAAPMMRRLLEAQFPESTQAAVPDSVRAVRPSAAQPPVNRVGGSASVPPADPDDLEFGPEFIRRENAREKKALEAKRLW